MSLSVDQPPPRPHTPFPVSMRSSSHVENTLLPLPAGLPSPPRCPCSPSPRHAGFLSVPQTAKPVLSPGHTTPLPTPSFRSQLMHPFSRLPAQPQGSPQALSITLPFYFPLSTFHHLTLSGLFMG